MKKVKILLFLWVFIISFNSSALAEQTVEKYTQENVSPFDKYESQNYDSSKTSSSRNTYEAEVYDLIYEAFMNLSDSIDLSKYKMDSTQVFEITRKVLYDHTEIFYYDYKNSSYWSSGKLEFNYTDTKSNVIKQRNELNQLVSDTLSKIITPGMSEFEKQLAIHDYIVLNTAYDYDNYLKNTIPKESYTTYGVMVKGVAVCQGYAETFKLLLNKVGIDSSIVSSTGMNHAWNIVNIDGENYQVDVTWNDPAPDRKGSTAYKHLNLTDNQMKKNHYWDYAAYPKSTSEKYSIFWDIDSPKKHDKMYYSSTADDYIYSLDDNLVKKQITSVRAPYFDVAGDFIYFSNYSRGGYLCSIRKDGTGEITELNSLHTIDVFFEDGYLNYTEKVSGLKKKLKLMNTPSEIKVESISLSKEKLLLKEDQIEKIAVSVYPFNATNKNVTWKSSNPNIASVDQKGVIKGISEGQTNIIALSADGNKIAVCSVVVEKNDLEYINLEKAFNTELNKIWTIKFNKDVDINSVNSETIYILDENANKVGLYYKIEGKSVKLIPKEDYKSEKKYKIYITKYVTSNNKSLKAPTLKEFNTQK